VNIAFVELTQAFDLVGTNGLFTMLQRRIVCPPKLLKIITLFHEDREKTCKILM